MIFISYIQGLRSAAINPVSTRSKNEVNCKDNCTCILLHGSLVNLYDPCVVGNSREEMHNWNGI